MRKILAALLAAAFVLALVPAAAFAAGIQAGKPTFTVNADAATTTVVGFGGKQWAVVGHGGEGVASSPCDYH